MKNYLKMGVLLLAGGLLTANTQASETFKIPEGTEVRIKFDEKLSSETSAEGDMFSIQVDDDVDIDGKVVIPAGARGRGEVTTAKKKGFMGKGGELNIRLNYIKVGDKKVRLRAQKGKAGGDKLGTSVALTVLFGPLGLLKRGADVTITQGQVMTAYVDDDVDVPFPPPPPPKID